MPALTCADSRAAAQHRRGWCALAPAKPIVARQRVNRCVERERSDIQFNESALGRLSLAKPAARGPGAPGGAVGAAAISGRGECRARGWRPHLKFTFVCLGPVARQRAIQVNSQALNWAGVHLSKTSGMTLRFQFSPVHIAPGIGKFATRIRLNPTSACDNVPGSFVR